MLDLFIGLKRVIKRRIVHIDNSVFRLHWLFTSIIFISCSLIVTSRQYVGDPIDCLQTDDIPSSVLNTYCWIHSTYTVPSAFDKIVGVEVPHPGIERSKGRIYEDAFEDDQQTSTTTSTSNISTNLEASAVTTQKTKRNRHLFRSTKHRKYYTYYQWVCFALFIQAILFYLPYYVWKIWEGGLLQAITLGMQLAMITDEERGRKRKILNDYLYSHLRHHKIYAYKYFFCEFLCFLNVTIQFYLMDWFFDGEFFQYGFKVLRYAKHDQSLAYDPMTFIFPRMTKCTFHSYGFSGDVQRHDALCMLTLNVVNEKIYIFIWFWLALLWILLICVLAYRIVILFAWNWRAYFLTKRCTLSYFGDLNYICKNGNIGDWFLLYMLGSNLDPLLMRDVTDEIAIRMRNEEKCYEIKPEMIKRKNDKIKKINSTLKKYENNDLSDCISLANNHHLMNSCLPSAPMQNQYCLDQNFSKTNCYTNYLNECSNNCSNNHQSRYIANCTNNCLSNNFVTPLKTHPDNQMKKDRIQHSSQCIEQCINHSQSDQQNGSMTYSQPENNDDDDDEINLIMDANQETIVANHCLKSIKDECIERHSSLSKKSNQSIKKNVKIKNNQLTVSNRCSNANSCSSNIAANLKNTNSRRTSNQTNISRKSSSSCCKNEFYANSQRSEENFLQVHSETSSLDNSSSGVGLDFESKLNDDDGSTSGLSVNQLRLIKCRNSQISSQNRTSGYQSNVFSNNSNNSDTLDQASSLEQASSSDKTSSLKKTNLLGGTLNKLREKCSVNKKSNKSSNKMNSKKTDLSSFLNDDDHFENHILCNYSYNANSFSCNNELLNCKTNSKSSKKHRQK